MSDGLKLMLASCYDDVCTTPECMCAERIDAALAAAEARGAERMREWAAQEAMTCPGEIICRFGWMEQKIPTRREIAVAIRALPLSTPEKQTEAAPASNGEAG